MDLRYFLISIFITCIFLQPTNAEYSTENDDLSPKYRLMLSYFVVITICCFFRYITMMFLKAIIVAYDVFLLTTGILIGIWVYYNPASEQALFATVDNNPLKYIYVSVLMFSLSYSIDVHGFYKSLPQILIISGPIFIMSSCLVGAIMKLVINIDWTWEKIITFGICCTPIFPLQVIRQLKEYGTGTRQITILLEGEALTSCAIFLVLFTLNTVQIHSGMVRHWYQYFALLIRFVGLGSLTGAVTGALGSWLMRLLYDNSISVFTVIVSIPFMSYYIAHYVIAASGNFAILFAGLIMARRRPSLSVEVDEFVSKVWHMIFVSVNSFFLVRIGSFITLEAFKHGFALKMANFGLITYLMECLCRFCSFAVFAPILSRLGFGLTFSNMVLCVWGGLKSPLGTFMMMVHFEDANRNECFILFIFFFISLLINGSLNNVLLKFLGLSEISTTKQINMNNCMRLISEKRNKSIVRLKMDRLMSDVNWSVLNEGTTLKHPYESKLMKNDDDVNFVYYRFSYCPDCNIEVINEPTRRELKEMSKDAKLRILKAKKISYARQYEEGSLSKEGLRILSHAVEIALDREEDSIGLDELFKLFQKECFISRRLRQHIDSLFEDHSTNSNIVNPKIHAKEKAYRIYQSKTFVIFVSTMLIANIVETSYEVYFWELHEYKRLKYMFTSVSTIFQMFYLLEFFVKFSAFSWIYAFSHGFRTYFTSTWNILEFTFLVIGCVDLIIDYIYTFSGKLDDLFNFFLVLRLFRAIRLLDLLRYCRFLSPALARYVDTRSNYHVALAYELGKAYVKGEEDVLDMLPLIIEHEKIHLEVKARIKEDRLAVIKLLGIVQKDKPWVAISVKTAQAIRTVLNVIRETIKELKMSGWVDEGEFNKLMNSLKAKNKSVSFSLKFVQANSPEVLFRGVDWMGDEQEIVDHLYQNAVVRKYAPGEVICEEGKPSEGIFILISGLLKQVYQPREEVLENLSNYGCLPIVDYLTASGYDKEFTEFLVGGNCVGELSTLTGRAYNCKIVAETRSTVFLLKTELMEEALKMSSDTIQGLSSRIWRSLSINIVFPVLLGSASLQHINIEKIKLALEAAVIPNLTNYCFFEVDVERNLVEDILLIEGVVADNQTRDHYIGPCFIPRIVNRLILPKSGLLDRPALVETKLLIVPDFNVRELKLKEEDDGTLKVVSTTSSTCVIHVLQPKRVASLQLPSERKSMDDKAKRRLPRLLLARKRQIGARDLKPTMSQLSDVKMHHYFTARSSAETHSYLYDIKEDVPITGTFRKQY